MNYDTVMRIIISICITGLGLVFWQNWTDQAITDEGIVSDQATQCNRYECRVVLEDGRKVSVSDMVLAGDVVIHRSGRLRWNLK